MAVLRAGATLKHGTFTIGSLLGRGGFGEVYLARQPRMDREVAVKVLSPGVAEEADIVRRFEREARAAGMLLHPNVLPVFDFDFDEDAGVWFLAMQYIPGGITLQNLMQGPMDPREVARIITAVASALDAAHERGIVHRDVKPPNVLMDGSRPMLTDFGIAHLGALTGMTQKGMAIGTPAYVSPEQGMGKEVGPSSDQYSLAVMTYQMLAGRPPFTGDSLSLVMQHVSTTPPALTTLNPGLPAEIAEVVHRALSKKPEDRFPTCGDFAAALAAAAAHVASGGTQPMGTPVGFTPGAPIRATIPPPPPGSAASVGRVAIGGPTVVSEAAPAPATTNGAASIAPRDAAPSRRSTAGRGGLPVPFIAAGVGAIVLLIVGGIAVKQLMGSQTAATVSTPPSASPTVVAAAPSPAGPDMGEVTIDSVPPAVVVVDDEPGARTPRQLQLKAGDHDLKLVAPTYQEWTRRVSVEAGQKLDIPPVELVPVPAADVVAHSVTDSAIGKDPYVDAGGIVRLATPTQTFRTGDDINAVVYLNPKTYGIRDLSFSVRWVFERAGGIGPTELTGDQQVKQDWDQTFIRACAPAAALDATGSNTPLSLTLFVGDTQVKTMQYQIAPGPVTGQTDCNKTTLPSVGAGT